MSVHELIKALNSVKPIRYVRNVVRSRLSRKCEFVIGFYDRGIFLFSTGGIFGHDRHLVCLAPLLVSQGAENMLQRSSRGSLSRRCESSSEHGLWI